MLTPHTITPHWLSPLKKQNGQKSVLNRLLSKSISFWEREELFSPSLCHAVQRRYHANPPLGLSPVPNQKASSKMTLVTYICNITPTISLASGCTEAPPPSPGTQETMACKLLRVETCLPFISSALTMVIYKYLLTIKQNDILKVTLTGKAYSSRKKNPATHN